MVHLRNFRVDEIIRITGWDKEKETLVFETVYPFGAKGVGGENDRYKYDPEESF